jgi:hypothetical protein
MSGQMNVVLELCLVRGLRDWFADIVPPAVNFRAVYG